MEGAEYMSESSRVMRLSSRSEVEGAGKYSKCLTTPKGSTNRRDSFLIEDYLKVQKLP